MDTYKTPEKSYHVTEPKIKLFLTKYSWSL